MAKTVDTSGRDVVQQKCNQEVLVAKDKGNYPEIYDELIRIRRDADEGINPQLLASSPRLCEVLGYGDPFLAAGELRDSLSTVAARGDRDVLAYFHSVTGRGDATDRLEHAGTKLFVENRRARDLSDVGALKLSQLIGSKQEFHVPFMGCALSIIGWNAQVEAYVMVANGFVDYRHPMFRLGDESVDFPHRRSDQGAWERHFYGPVTFPVEEHRTQFVMTRVGTPRMRVNTILRSNNAEVDVTSTLMYLSYSLDLVVRRFSPACDGE